jgi:cell wall-associated NlpC family hydrolase
MYIGKGKFIHSTTHDHPVVQISLSKTSLGRCCWWPAAE